MTSYQGNNGGIPTPPPASTPERNGPLSWWRGHPSPCPGYGRLEADPGYVYRVEPSPMWGHPTPPARDNLCNHCVVAVRYRHVAALITWRDAEPGDVCDECDRWIHGLAEEVPS